MIRSYRNKATQAIHRGEHVRRLPPDVSKRARMRLDRIDAAVALDDLRVPPSHRLEKLSGERAGQWSIRVNDQWRICLRTLCPIPRGPRLRPKPFKCEALDAALWRAPQSSRATPQLGGLGQTPRGQAFGRVWTALLIAYVQ